MTVVPLFCAKLIKKHQADETVGEGSIEARFGRISKRFNAHFGGCLEKYDRTLSTALLEAGGNGDWAGRSFMLCFALYPLVGVSFFPRTDPGQFVINLKAPSGTRVELTEEYVKKVEEIIREVVPKNELQIIVSNIGITPDFSLIYTPNSAPHTAFVQVSLKRRAQSRQLRVHAERARTHCRGICRS